jgi:glycosyltransferase involved in cell wall biosynthesis
MVEGFRVHRVEAGRARKHREFRLWYNLARYVWRRRRDFDILHSHGAYYSCSIVGLLARMTGMGSIVKASLANDDLQDLSRLIIGAIHRAFLRRVDAYVATSQDLVGEFRSGGLAPERIRYLPNGVDTKRFVPGGSERKAALREAMSLPAHKPIALYVGVMDQRKNIQWLAETWVAKRAFGTGAQLLAVGPRSRDDVDGVLIERLHAVSGAHPDLFQLRGFTSDIADLYRAVDLLVLPSSKEGLPNVILEAMACGLPCVATDASGSRELIVNGKTGFLCQRDDGASLAAAVHECLSPRGRELGWAGREMVEQRFSISVVADGYAALYRALIANPGHQDPGPEGDPIHDR